MPDRRLFLLGGAGLALTACADTRATSTGFLPGHETLRPPENDPEGDRSYRRANAPRTGWRGYRIETVAWRPAPTVPAGLPPEDIEAALAGYRAALDEFFGERLPVAEAGPGVIRIRAAVTDIRWSIPVLNVLVMAVVRVPPTSGGASSESEVVDDTTGERIAALAAYNNGGRSFLGGPFGFMSEYGHARRALRLQARRLRDLTLGDAA